MQTNFSLVQHHKYSLTELENMMPWEREVYVIMLVKNLGLRVNKKKYWGSSTISLIDPQDLIIKKFKQRWRRCFKKSLNQNIIIDEIRDSFKAENLVCKYNTKLQKENNGR